MDEQEMKEAQEIGLTQAEEEALKAAGYGYPEEDKKHNVFTFFKEIISARDTTRTSNLDTTELGRSVLPVRTNLELAAFCDAMNMKGFAECFRKEAGITTDTALSKNGALINLAVTQKRQFERNRRGLLSKKGWFTKKEPEEE